MSGGPDTPRRWVHGALLYFLLFGLGLASVVWNLAAVLLYPVLPAGRGQALGRAAISISYRFFWAVAQRVGMMRIDYAALEPLRDGAQQPVAVPLKCYCYGLPSTLYFLRTLSLLTTVYTLRATHPPERTTRP